MDNYPSFTRCLAGATQTPLRPPDSPRSRLRPLVSSNGNPTSHAELGPNRPWGHSKGPKGAPEPRLTGPYSPGSALSVENHCFGPWVCQLVLGTQHRDVHCMGPPPPNLVRIPPKLPPGVAGSNGGPIPHWFSNWAEQKLDSRPDWTGTGQNGLVRVLAKSHFWLVPGRSF